MRFAFPLLFLIFCFIRSEANNIQVLKDGPIHEAFVTKESGALILRAVPDKPPPPLTEEIPEAPNEELTWISGYWSWEREVGDYIWICGVWRRPPPHHYWQVGRWKQYPNGWVWMPGFWSRVPASDLVYIPKPPPDPIEEKVSTPPPPAGAYSWISGYWEWDERAEVFRWLSGKWDLMGQEMLYIPAQYYWRENGYFLIPGFWDWPIEDRGIAYADVAVDAEDRERVVVEPSHILNSLYIMELLYPHWPDYLSLFHYHFYTHYHMWISWGTVPPWWNWSSWWSFNRENTWWLWWWWTHPGYPNPSWLDAAEAAMIAPPSEFVLKMMKAVVPPPIVTANGVVGSKELIEAIIKASGKKSPILSSDPKQVNQIQDLADPKTPYPPYLKPTGRGKVNRYPSKPINSSSNGELKRFPGRVRLPDFPKVSGHEIMPGMQIPPERPEKPSHSSPFQPTTQTDPLQAESSPPQGYQPSYEYPQNPMQTEHRNDLMTKPQPQVNPEGPKVHQYPGDESTLPNY